MKTEVPTTITTRCGTAAGHEAHKRRSEVPCRDCRDATNEYNRLWRNLHPNNYKEYYQANREKVLNRVKESSKKHEVARVAYREETSEHIKERNRKWREANPEVMAIHARTRRALRLSANHEPYTEAQVLERWGTDCHVCHEPVDLNAPRLTGVTGWERGLHLEHVLGLILGGSDTIENVKPAHGLCNLKKKRKSA